jgi:hypothetical protein
LNFVSNRIIVVDPFSAQVRADGAQHITAKRYSSQLLPMNACMLVRAFHRLSKAGQKMEHLQVLALEE